MINKRQGRDKRIEGIRPLTREDLSLLGEKRNSTPLVQRLRDPHHNLARLIAAGVRPLAVAAERAGYSYVRAQQLLNDPAFQELIAGYRKEVTAEFLEGIDDYAKLATSNMMKAERHIAERIERAEEEGELISIKDALAISRDAADRFGYGKKQTNTNINVDFAAALEKAIARSGKVITHTAEPTRASPQIAPQVEQQASSAPAAPAAPRILRRA